MMNKRKKSGAIASKLQMNHYQKKTWIGSKT